MSDDLISRSEHNDAIARLEAADQALQRQIIDTERVLRDEFGTAMRELKGDLKDDFMGMSDKQDNLHSSLQGDLKEVKDHLTWQDRTIGGGVLAIITGVAIYWIREKLGF